MSAETPACATDGQKLTPKLERYSQFIHSTHAELQSALKARDALFDRISEYQKLEKQIRTFRDARLTDLESMVDLGCNFYATAHCPSTATIHVETIHGMFMELSQDQALGYISKATELLAKKAELKDQTIAGLRAKIRMVVAAAREALESEQDMALGRKRNPR